MNNVRVSLCKPTPQGRLHYRYDPQIDEELVLLKSAVSERWSYFVNINGGDALFDLDANRILRVAEFVIPKRAWVVVPTLDIPHVIDEADIQFIEVMHSREYLTLPVVVTTNTTQSHVCIVLGEREPDMFWISLSKNCSALIVKDRLKGFFVALK